jgi:hypothetical protein
MQKLLVHEAPSICFISSHTWDVQAAAQFGFQAVRVNRFGLINDRIPGTPSAVIELVGVGGTV